MSAVTSNFETVLGRHAIIDVWGCNPTILSDTFQLRELVFKAADLARTTVLGSIEKQFEPQGFTIVLLLAESHLSLHTWPEIGFASADLYSCNLETNFEAVCKYFETSLEAQGSQTSILERKMNPTIMRLSNLAERNHLAPEWVPVNGKK